MIDARLLVAALITFAASATPSSASIPAPADQTADERSVLAADSEQRRAVTEADLAAIEAISHPSLRINAPSNRILTRGDLVRMVSSGEIRNEVLERTPEDLVITGKIAVVMGRETVFPGAASEQARLYGVKTLERRYTNVYLRAGDGKWRHLARHANVVPPAAGR